MGRLEAFETMMKVVLEQSEAEDEEGKAEGAGWEGRSCLIV